MKFLAYNVFSIICVLSACVLACLQISEWGWFLLVGFICAVVPGSKDQ